MKRALVVLMIVTSLGISPLAAQERFTFQSGPDIHTQVSEQVVREAYTHLGLTVQFKHLPWKDALTMSNAGQLDGEVHRIAGLTATFPNLVMIPVPVNFIETLVLTKEADVVLAGPESLRPYTIGLIRGIVLHDKLTQGMQRTFATTGEQLFRLLEKGSVDVVLYGRLGALEQVHQFQLAGITIVEPPLDRTDLYHYVHTKHAPLVPRLTATLKKMAAEGRIAGYRRQAVAKLSP